MSLPSPPEIAAAPAGGSRKEAAQGTAEVTHSRDVTPAVPPAPRLPGPPEIAFRVGGVRDQDVEVRVREGAGGIDVVVRGRNSELASELRGQLGDLVARLEDRGYEARTWIPGEGTYSEIRTEKSSAEGFFEPGDRGTSHGREQQAASSDGRQQQRRNRPHWLDRFEHTYREEARQ
ncbi:MAG: hypothetical protein SFV54_11365 [Bryobacteraceae bacterium]|nr:hypothetical protein [Bryobacteraceae bacterium]